MAKRKRVVVARPELNITAMMDLVLNLITFFVLISNFSAAQLPSINPPRPDQSVAKPSEEPNVVTVNIKPSSFNNGTAGALIVGVTEIPMGDYTRLTELLARETAINEKVAINLRADRSLRYDQVAPVMSAITTAGITKLHIVAVSGE